MMVCITCVVFVPGVRKVASKKKMVERRAQKKNYLLYEKDLVPGMNKLLV